MMNKSWRRSVFLNTLGLAVIVLVGIDVHAADAERYDPPLRAVGAIYPRLAPSGEEIVFACQGAIWRMPRSGGTMTRLTADDGFDIEPAWSPDGKTVAYIK